MKKLVKFPKSGCIVKLINGEHLSGRRCSRDRSYYRLEDEFGLTEIPARLVLWIRHATDKKE